jgi:hypothetical protein
MNFPEGLENTPFSKLKRCLKNCEKKLKKSEKIIEK